MRVKLLSLIVAMSIVPVAAHAQLVIDMASVRCDQYLAMPPEQLRNFSSWMSGWFSYRTGRTFVDFTVHQQNVASVQAWCQAHWDAPVMSALKAAIGQ